MPELPEVETIYRGLKSQLKNKKIKNFTCDWSKMINKPLKEYQSIIKGLKIKTLKRRARMLIFNLDQDWNILIHLKMTGQLVFDDQKKCLIGGHPIKEGFACLPNKFTHATFIFTDKSRLYYNDVRKFGWLRLFKGQELKSVLANMDLGPEPLEKEFTYEYFKAQLKKRPNNQIKKFLMDNHNLVGVGNIYSDEVCFYAQVLPYRKVESLTESEIKLIFKGIKKILTAAIKAQGTTFSNYRNSQGESGAFSKQLKVYGRYGQNCKKCKTEIKRMKISGRTSSYCPTCQN